MGVSILPKAITKDKLFEKVQKRFQFFIMVYTDNNLSAQDMYEEMSCSMVSGNPEHDFPDEVKAEQDSTIRYQYRDGNCYFIIDDIEVEVQDLRSMRKSPCVGKETYANVCVLTISYTDEDGMYMYHVVPDAWLYGSMSHDFDEGEPVHDQFIAAARKYIKEHNITKEMQEVQD